MPNLTLPTATLRGHAKQESAYLFFILEMLAVFHSIKIPATINMNQHQQQSKQSWKAHIFQPSQIQQLLSVYIAIIQISFVTLKSSKKQTSWVLTLHTRCRPAFPMSLPIRIWSSAGSEIQFQGNFNMLCYCIICAASLRGRHKFIFSLSWDFFFPTRWVLISCLAGNQR